MNKIKKQLVGLGTVALCTGSLYVANAQDVPDLPIYGISSSVSKTPALTLGGGQFFPVQNKLRLTDGVDPTGMKLMNDDGEEFLLEERDGITYVGGEIKYSEVYTANWPEAGKYLPVPVILQGPMNIGHVNFASGSATLDAADRQLISAMADEIEHTGLKSVYLVGRTDSVGSYEGNLELSLMRVNAVKKYLKTHLENMGITDVSISTEYMGDLTASAKLNPEDRRVDVTIYPKI